MKNAEFVNHKIMDLQQLLRFISFVRFKGETVSFTNGCFDILHEGHIYSLSQAAKEADYLIVGVNSDASTKRLKGNDRPVNREHSRALLLASLLIVDAVTIFEEDTPLELINAVKPDVLVKGGDYIVEEVVGAKEVLSLGGRVIINPLIEGFSTTGLIEKIKRL